MCAVEACGIDDIDSAVSIVCHGIFLWERGGVVEAASDLQVVSVQWLAVSVINLVRRVMLWMLLSAAALLECTPCRLWRRC